jgi:hypothetical protein
MVLEHERSKQHVRAASGGAAATSFFVDVLRIRELISGASQDLDISPKWTVAALKDRIHEVLNVNRAVVSVMVGCDVLDDGVRLQVTRDA